MCEKCGTSVNLAEYNSHTCRVSKPDVCEELPVEAILNKSLDEPLTTIEERLKSNLARRAISQNSQSLLSIKTGGQVRYTNTLFRRIQTLYSPSHLFQCQALVSVVTMQASVLNADGQ